MAKRVPLPLHLRQNRLPSLLQERLPMPVTPCVRSWEVYELKASTATTVLTLLPQWVRRCSTQPPGTSSSPRKVAGTADMARTSSSDTTTEPRHSTRTPPRSSLVSASMSSKDQESE